MVPLPIPLVFMVPVVSSLVMPSYFISCVCPYVMIIIIYINIYLLSIYLRRRKLQGTWNLNRIRGSGKRSSKVYAVKSGCNELVGGIVDSRSFPLIDTV